MDGSLVPRLSPPPWIVRQNARSWLTAFLRAHHGRFVEDDPALGLVEYLKMLGCEVRAIDLDKYVVQLPVRR
jgi:hypothetical protein